MRWTRQRRARNVFAGRVSRERSTSALDERRMCGRQNRVVLTPRRRRQVCGWLDRPDRADKPYSADDGDKKARSPGRARNKSLKPLRAGMPGDSGGPVVTISCALFHFAREAAGATGTRHSPRPFRAKDSCAARAYRAARARMLVFPGNLKIESEIHGSHRFDLHCL